MSVPDQPFLRSEKDGGVIMDLHVLPNATQSLVQGLHDDALKVRIKAPAVDGKANQVLLAWLARKLGIPRTGIELVRGQTARRKQVRIAPACAKSANWAALLPLENT